MQRAHVQYSSLLIQRRLCSRSEMSSLHLCPHLYETRTGVIDLHGHTNCCGNCEESCVSHGLAIFVASSEQLRRSSQSFAKQNRECHDVASFTSQISSNVTFLTRAEPNIPPRFPNWHFQHLTNKYRGSHLSACSFLSVLDVLEVCVLLSEVLRVSGVLEV